jgi:hypothetical protein
MFKIVLTDDSIKIAEYKSRNVYKVLSAITYLVYKKYRM